MAQTSQNPRPRPVDTPRPASVPAATRMKTAALYRMMSDQHLCPFGLKSLHPLKSEGYEVEDHPLHSRAEIDAFKARYDVKTTPQVFIGGQRIGGYDDLRRYFGKPV